jgi:hypothetical protein
MNVKGFLDTACTLSYIFPGFIRNFVTVEPLEKWFFQKSLPPSLFQREESFVQLIQPRIPNFPL